METLDVLRRAPAGKARLLVVLCHGVGANGADLIGLAEPWGLAVPAAAFLAPDAPERAYGAPDARQWFSLDDRTPSVLEAGAARATPVLLATVDAELARLGLPAERVVLMGFSQGAMMVLFAGLRRRPAPLGIMAYSGAMLAGPGLASAVSGRPPVLLVHGEADDVVPFARGPAAESTLRGLGVPVTTAWRPGLGHGIDEAGIARGSLFLQEVSAAVTGS